jgi:dienelactone hydrolase
MLAGMGYVVLCVNPRGSDGYGERFRREVVRDWGGKDYADLMSALDQLIERTGYIDTNRLGIGGGSYGGYMTNWVIGQTDRFSAAVAMRSISNLVSEYAQHDIVLWGVLELGVPPWPDLDELWKRSPIRYVKNIRTPLLLTHGEMDLRCAISQAEELFGAMRLLGKTVEMVRFPEESHDLSRAGRPDRRVERLRRIAGWYERFLGTAATDRVVEEETQVLPVLTRAVPQEVHQETAEVVEVTPVAEAPAAESVALPEPDVAETMVLQTLASGEAAIAEPEALPHLPALEPEPEPTPEQEATPELLIAVETEPEPQPEPEEADQVTEPDHEPHPEVEPAIAAAQTEQEADPELPPARPWLETAQLDAEPELEPEPEPDLAAEEPEPEPEPEPVVAAAAEPEPVAQAPEAIKSTMLRWPGSTAPGLPTLGNGSPTTPPETFEEATSIIPAWQHTDPASDSTRTVSLQALPLEQIAAGTGYSALLTFESGPFAGRIVALPSQMVTVGRAPDNDVVVGDPATSGHHGRIEPRAGSFWMSDLGSTNGTLINGEPVIEKQLTDGDLIAIGQNTIRFTLEG